MLSWQEQEQFYLLYTTALNKHNTTRFLVTLYAQYRNKVLSALTPCICGIGVHWWQIYPQSDLGFITASFFHNLKKPHALSHVWFFIPGLKRVGICPKTGNSHILYSSTIYLEVGHSEV